MSLPILAHLVRDKAAELGDATILTFVDVDRQGNYTEETRSYRELWSRGQALARWLASRGLAKGDRFAVMMANHPEFVDLMVASSILGTVFVPIDPRSRGDKLRFMLEFAGCRGVFAGLEALPAIEELWGGGRAEVATIPLICERRGTRSTYRERGSIACLYRLRGGLTGNRGRTVDSNHHSFGI